MTNDMDDFTFYLQFTKSMALSLPNIKDRAMVALWLEKLSEINKHNPKDNLHVEYLKLLLFALQKNNLVGFFKEHPPEGSLMQYPEMITAIDMIKLMKTTKIKSSSLSPIYTAIGGDMREFTAVQEIPKFGLHGYYAMSHEPLPLWTHNKSGLFKSNKSIKNISRFKESHEYKMLNKITFPKTSSHDKQPYNWTHKTDVKLNQIENEKVPETETRPCWGTSHYFERLIDQSPYITADLEVATADALLHAFKDKITRPEANASCVSSMKKKQFSQSLRDSLCTYDSEYKRIQCLSNCDISGEQLLNPRGIDNDSANCCAKQKANIPRNKRRNKWKNDDTYESSTFSKGCLLNSDYYARL